VVVVGATVVGAVVVGFTVVVGAAVVVGAVVVGLAVVVGAAVVVGVTVVVGATVVVGLAVVVGATVVGAAVVATGGASVYTDRRLAAPHSSVWSASHAREQSLRGAVMLATGSAKALPHPLRRNLINHRTRRLRPTNGTYSILHRTRDRR